MRLLTRLSRRPRGQQSATGQGGRKRPRPLARWGTAVAVLALVAAAMAGTGVPARAAVPKTIVSLTFDDGNADQLAAEQVLKAHGLVGTFFVTTSWIGSPTWLTQANLHTIAADGNEIGGHTVTHPDLPTISSSAATAEVCNGRSTLMGWGFGVTAFAYPFASENAAVERIVKNCGFTSARNLGDIRSPGSCSSCPYAETIPPANAYNTAALDEVDSSWTLKNLQDSVTNAETHNGGWVQLTFHHIAVGTDPSLTISPALFEQFVTWLAARTAGGTTVVQTVSQALGNSQPPPANQAPVAAFTSSAVGLTAAFDGSGSADPDGSIATYSWDFGDGSTGTGAKPSHPYSAAGTFPVKLTVTDNLGATGTTTRSVSVAAPPPPTAPAAPTGVSATAGNAAATVSWSAPGNGGSAITSYTVTPYIGTTAQPPVQVTGAPPATTRLVPGLSNGTAYTFKVTATNAVGTSPASAASAPVTPTAAVLSVVANGGFESALTSWTAGGVSAPKAVAAAHSGTGSALLGVVSGKEPLGNSTLSQAVTVPATGTTTLSFWYQPHTTDGSCGGTRNCRWDWMEGQIRSSSGSTLATVFKLNNNSGRWTRVTADLTAFKGQTVTLWFNVHLDGAVPADNTWMYLDDVTVTTG
jgi:peptidoglycan/xylan/chitin deacetylase (PgdA/CDA1 family)/PKD repeat protein